jgi:peptidyl-prolyl cis-trans isomerase D
MLEKISAENLKKQMTSGKFTVKSFVSMAIFTAIILVFVFFGFPSQNDNSFGVGYAATVNNALISINDFKGESARIEQMYAPLFGSMGGAMAETQRQFLKQQALDNLINRELLSQAAQKEKVYSTDEEIRTLIINEIPAFQRDGRFQREIYDQLLAANNLSKGEFETRIRKDQQTQKLRRLLDLGAASSIQEVQKIKALKEKKYNLLYAKLEKDLAVQKISVSEGEVSTKLSDKAFQGRVDNYYTANKAEFSKPEEIRASHILIKFQNGDGASEASALEKIKKIKESLRGSDFATIAKKESQDEGSKIKGGDLGFFSKGRMVPEFEQVAFAAQLNAISEPIRSQFGYHLIKVTDRKAGSEKSLEQARPEIAKKLISEEKFEAKLTSIEESLKNKNMAEVDKSLADFGAKWQETGFFDLENEAIPNLGIAAAPILSDVNMQNPLLGRIVREEQGKFLFKVKEIKNEVISDIEPIRQKLNQEKSNQVFSTWLEASRKAASIEANQDLLK